MKHVAIVTGGASGIGKAVVEEYNRLGIAVIIADVQDDLGQELATALSGQGGKVMYVRCDVTSHEDQQHVVDVAMKTYGRLDIAVNNAGIGGEANPTGSYSLDGWHQVININLNGAFLGMRSQIPAMITTGGGSIVNVASILGAVGFPGAPAYVTAKHGLVGLTKAAALDHALQGIRVNAVGPGFIETPLIAGIIADPTQRDYLTSLHPMDRLGHSEELAELICFLTSEKASFITGSYYPVDGGYLAR